MSSHCESHARMKSPEDGCPVCLTAKLQAAEAMVATAHPPKMIRDLVSKLQAAEAENARLHAEVARLRDAWEKRGEHMQNWERDYFRVCKERDAALAESNNLIVKVQFAEAVIRDKKQIERTATEAALRWAWKESHKAHTMAPYLHNLKRDEYIARGLKALLGEGWDA